MDFYDETKLILQVREEMRGHFRFYQKTSPARNYNFTNFLFHDFSLVEIFRK